MKPEVADKVMAVLGGLGITARIFGNQVAVNRDSMCNSGFASSGIPEMTVYPAVIYAVEDGLGKTENFLFWAGKTDDDLFMDTLRND